MKEKVRVYTTKYSIKREIERLKLEGFDINKTRLVAHKNGLVICLVHRENFNNYIRGLKPFSITFKYEPNKEEIFIAKERLCDVYVFNLKI